MPHPDNYVAATAPDGPPRKVSEQASLNIAEMKDTAYKAKVVVEDLLEAVLTAQSRFPDDDFLSDERDALARMADDLRDLLRRDSRYGIDWSLECAIEREERL